MNPFPHSRPIRFLTIAVVFAQVLGCTVNPVTGEQEFSLVSAEQEVAIGHQQYQPSQQAQGGRYYIDPTIEAYVATVGKKLAAVCDRPNLPYEFVVLNNGTPNAWALPGGKIAINRGLLGHLNDEAELAAVLGHEIVHAAARHSAAQITRGTLINIGAQALGSASQQAGYGELGGLAAQLGATAWMARYGRGDELESDAYGMDYMVRAGYDPAAAVRVQQTFVDLSKGRQRGLFSDLFASHPPSQARVDANRARLAKYPSGGLVNAEPYKHRMARLRKDKSAYEAQARAVEALQKRKPRAALDHLDSAVTQQPAEGQFWELRGHAWRMLDQHDNAEKAFTNAIRRNPDYFSHHLARGVLRVERQQFERAAPDLQRSQQLLKTPIAHLYLGDIAARRNNRREAIAQYREAAKDRGEIGEKARQKLARLEIGENPGKYIALGLSLSPNQQLILGIENRGPVTVTGLTVQAAGALGSRSFGIPVKLAPGARYSINTGIGPLDTETARAYRVSITYLQVAE